MENQELWLKIRTREKGGLSPSFLRLQALPFSDRLRFTRNELWVASQIIQERKAACSWHPSFLTASPHLQIKQIYHSVMGAAEGGRGGRSVECPGADSRDGCRASLRVTHRPCSSHVTVISAATQQLPRPFPSNQNPPKADRATPPPTGPRLTTHLPLLAVAWRNLLGHVNTLDTCCSTAK